MSKDHGYKIIIGSIIGALLVAILFLLAIRFTFHSCELIVIEPARLRSAGMAAISNRSALRSNDKSLLLKMSAHLEYNVGSSNQNQHQDSGSSGQSWQVPAQASQPQASQFQATLQQQQPTVQPLNVGQSSSVQSVVQQQQQQPPQGMASGLNKHPTPSNVQSGFTSQQLQNSSYSPNNANQMSTFNGKDEKRFLPLDLDKVSLRKRIDDTRLKYKLDFNCSTMDLIFVRRSDKVYVEQISVELKVPVKGKSSCEVQLPNQGAFSVDVHDYLAHYSCERPLHYPCYHYSTKNSNRAGLLLAELHIHSIEFEIGSNSSSLNLFNSDDFLSTKKECELPPGGILL